MSDHPVVSPDSMPENGEMLHEQLYRYAEDLQLMVARNRELENTYQLLNELVKSSNDMHLVTDKEGVILETNPAAWQIAEQELLERSNLENWVLASHLDQFNALLDYARQDDAPLAAQEGRLLLRRRRDDAPAMLVSAQIVNQHNGTDHLHWILRELTQHNAEYDPTMSATLLLNTVEGVMVTDQNGKILAVNPAFTHITGYSQSEAIGQNPRMLNSGTQDKQFYREFWQSLFEKGNWKGELYNKRKNGEIFLQRLSVSAVRDDEGKTLSYICIFFDQTQTEKQLVHLAHHDVLTGLANRVLLGDRIMQQLSKARRSDGQFTLIFIDLDRFKQITDTLGHAIGDAVLCETAARLIATVRESDTVARLGGDEFIILAGDLAGDEDIRMLCDKTIAALSEPMQFDEHEIHIGSSFGCAEYPRHGDTEALLMLHADQAMYQAKSTGGSTCVIYHADIDLPC
jgi:diguanylate cyclase (GGDEF)-like protein/PAS domain S-box-containing protein